MIPTRKMKTRPAEKLRSSEDARVHEWPLGGEGVGQEQVEGEAGDGGLGDDLGRAEPVQLLAAVEHQLQRADRDAERDEAEPVERDVRRSVSRRKVIRPRKVRMPTGRLT